MLRTLQTARQSLHLEQTRIDTLANNLANAATSGFRQVLTCVTEKAPGILEDPPPEAAVRSEPVDAVAQTLQELRGAPGWVVARPLQMSQAVDMRPGALEATGRSTDVALSGPGFFVVHDLEGNELVTRNGSFNLDASGNLMAGAGLLVQGTGGPIQAAGGVLTIGTDGSVLVDGQERGRLRIVDFPEPHHLLPRGDGCLTNPPDQTPSEVPAGQVTVLQGHLEGSNVDAVRTLVDMIAAQRAFEVGAKVLQANDEMLGQSVNTLGRNT